MRNGSCQDCGWLEIVMELGGQAMKADGMWWWVGLEVF